MTAPSHPPGLPMGAKCMAVRDFLTTGPCEQRPGLRNRVTGKVITTCVLCDGIMRQGDCLRDRLRAYLDTTPPTGGTDEQ